MPAGLLDQVPDGYVQVVQWDVASLLNDEGLDDLQDKFLEAWEWVEEYGIFLDDVTNVVSANDDRSNSLWLLSGEFEWDDVRDDLDDVGFDDSEYRNVEVWEESSRGLTVGLLEDRGLVVISSPEDDGVKDVIRALQSGEGFLFEDTDLEITRVLGRVKVGFQMMAEEGCGDVDVRSCKGVAYSVGRGEDELTLNLEWVFLFRSDSSARSGSSDIEDYFEDEMPSEVDVEDVEQDGEYVVVRATIDEEDLSLPSRITEVEVRPSPTPDVIFPTSTPTAPAPTSIAPSATLATPFSTPTAAGMVQVGALVQGDIGSSGEVDEYQVALDGGSIYIIETVLDTLGDSELYIFDVDGQTELDHNDDFLDRESRIEFTAPRSGVYYIRVNGFETSVGSYQLSITEDVSVVIAVTSTPPASLPTFPAPIPTSNIVLSVEGDIGSSGEVDEYVVFLEGGRTYIIETELGTLPDSVLRILDIDGQTELGFNDDFDNLESRIDFAAPRSGVYFVQVNGFSVSVGSYALSITEDISVVIVVTPTAVPVPAPQPTPTTVSIPAPQPTPTPASVPAPQPTDTPVSVPAPQQQSVTVVFGDEPVNLGVYGIGGCIIIPSHFSCTDAVSDPLTYIDSTTFEVVPLSGVESWEQISEDTWRFILRDGVKFHNGEDWNAAAAKAGIDESGDPDNFHASFFYTGSSHGEVVDDMTVDVVCDDPCPILPRTAFLILFQAPDWYAGASESERVSKTVGFGPYKFGTWNRGVNVELEIYEDYLPNDAVDAQTPTIQEITQLWMNEQIVRAAMVAVGEVDWAFDLGLDQQNDVPVFDHGGAAETFVNVFDTIWHPELKKQNVRLALSYATDCQSIVDELYDSFYECQGTFAPPGTLGVTARTLAPYPFDPDLSFHLLAEANYDPANEIVINVFAGRFFRNVEVAEFQAQMWRDVGVTVSVINQETAKWLDVARTGCGRAIDEFADLDNPPDDFCLSLPPGPPLFASPNTYQLNPSLETLDFAAALNRMDCLDLNTKFCDPVNVQPLLAPARAAVGDDRLAKMTELADIAYDEAIIYTYFNAAVFYGVSDDLVWAPRYDRRLRVNQWRFN